MKGDAEAGADEQPTAPLSTDEKEENHHGEHP